MQPVIAAHLRPRAEEFLTEATADERHRYFARTRLSSLGLPGGARPGLFARALGAQSGASRITEIQLALRGARRRGKRAWKALRGG